MKKTRLSFLNGAVGSLRFIASLAVALFLINFSVTFHNVWPTLWITTRHELSIEIAVLVCALALYSEVRAPPRWSMTALTFLLLLFCIGRYAEVTAPALYGRPVNVYWDAPHILRVIPMLSRATSPLVTTALALSLITLLVAVSFTLRWSLERVQRSLRFTSIRRTLAASSVGVILLYLIGHTGLPLHTLGWFSLPVSSTYWQQGRFILSAVSRTRGAGSGLCPRAATVSDLSRLSGADVFIVFLESYGATAYDRRAISEMLADSRQELEQTIAASGRNVVSAFVESPTFGGASWLAHMSLLTGRSVEDNGTYSLLLTQDCDVLTDQFARHGYRTIGVMPGLKREWPEGAFYGFDVIYGERALAYRGAEFGWWRIPDQYALAKLDELELARGSRAPRFVFFPTISSHIPFRPTPPYQPDWPRLLTEQPYQPQVAADSLARQPDWTNLGPAYADTIRYAFRYLAGYLRERADLDLALVLIGDHQPPASVSGEGARWDVPVHVITSKEEISHTLLSEGFVTGLKPESEAIGSMHELRALLLEAFASDTALPMDSTGHP